MSTRVGLDYLPAVTHWPGVGRYARELVRALVRLESAPELRLIEFGGEERHIGEPAIGLAGNESRFQRRSIRLPRRALHMLSFCFGTGADTLVGGADIFHRILIDFPPVKAAIQTMAVGELPPPDTDADRQLGKKLNVIDHLFVASRHAERELNRRYDIPAERIHFVSLGCDHWLRDLPNHTRVLRRPSIIVLGAVREERRQLEILGAFELLFEKGAVGKLVIVGGGIGAARDRFRSALHASTARESVEWLEAPNEADLPKLVADASVLVHLSRGEETAVTPLEAFSFGTAVVTNPGGAFEEALGETARYFDTTGEGEVDVTELASSIERAIEESADEELRTTRRAIASEFTWESSARRTADVWEAIASAR